MSARDCAPRNCQGTHAGLASISRCDPSLLGDRMSACSSDIKAAGWPGIARQHYELRNYAQRAAGGLSRARDFTAVLPLREKLLSKIVGLGRPRRPAHEGGGLYIGFPT